MTNDEYGSTDHSVELNRALRNFRYEHLPERLQEVSKEFYFTATTISTEFYMSDQAKVAMHYLLLAKDAAVRACIDHELEIAGPQRKG